MAWSKVGRVRHYYDKIGVAIIEVDVPLKVGDKIKFVHGGEDLFEQEVTSIQKEHENIESAKKGDDVGVKTESPVKEGTEVFKA